METNDLKSWGLAIAGSIVGGIAGHFVFKWAFSQGFYALVIPGVCVGWAAGFYAHRRNAARGYVAAGVALITCVYSEWDVRPFIADESLGYFLTHLHKLEPFSLIMMLLGAFLAYSMGSGRNKI